MSEMHNGFFRIAAVKLFSMVLLPLLVLGFGVAAVNNHVLHAEIDRSNENYIRYMAEHINRLTNDFERLNYSLTTNPAVTLRLKTAMQHAADEGIHTEEFAMFNAILDLIYATDNQNPMIDSIYIYFEDGEEFFIGSKKRLTNLREYYDVGWYDTYLQSDTFLRAWNEIRTVTDDEGTEHQLLTMYSRIFAGGTGSDRGVFILNINQSQVDALLRSLDDEWDTSVCVLGVDGEVIFSNDQFKRAFADADVNALVNEATQMDVESGPLQRFTVNMNGVPYISVSQPMETYGWRMISMSPARSLYARPIRMLGILLGMLGVTMVFGGLFANHIARHNSQELRNVMRSIQKAKQGRTVRKHNGKELTYDNLLQNVVDTFLDNEYLTVQLAERRHHVKLLELQSLQMQLNPHFLFNTMTTIQWKTLALTGSRNPASDMIENLSDLLHYVLDTRTELTDVASEIQITNSYVEIQKIRYADQFEYSCECKEELMGKPIMKMLLQPLVENSIMHGMPQDGSMLHVRIKIFIAGELLCICIQDNGTGMDEQRLEEVRKRLLRTHNEDGRHIGLYNVNKRIILTYGEAYGIKINSEKGNGTEICIHIPLENPINYPLLDGGAEEPDNPDNAIQRDMET